jgi:hypothetical protein
MNPDDSGVFDASYTHDTEPSPPPSGMTPRKSGQFEVPSLHQLAREVGAEFYDENID